jgi:hypothetical protein
LLLIVARCPISKAGKRIGRDGQEDERLGKDDDRSTD